MIETSHLQLPASSSLHNLFQHKTKNTEEERIHRQDSSLLQAKLLRMDTSKTKNSNCDYEVKIILLGDSGVGKTSLLRAWCEGEFNLKFLPTIGLDYRAKNVVVNSQRLNVQVWDTAGQERFRVITTAYYRGSHGFFLVYDVTDRKTFNAVSGWVKSVTDHTSLSERKVRFVLVGNKVDLPNRVVKKEEGESLAKAFGAPYFETSAKNFGGIELAFMILLQEILDEFSLALATSTSSCPRLTPPITPLSPSPSTQSWCSCG